jgi:hypothetical protein
MRAAQNELDDAGRPVADEKKIVFPGLELTLTAPNCQAVLILDVDFPEKYSPKRGEQIHPRNQNFMHFHAYGRWGLNP